MASREFRLLDEKRKLAPSPIVGTPDVRRAAMDAATAKLPLAAGTVAEEIEIAGVRGMLCSRSTSIDSNVIVWLHGGGYRVGSAFSYRVFGSHLADVCRARVMIPDYALAPERPFPAAFQDALGFVSEVIRVESAHSALFLAGDSAGGGLAVACAAELGRAAKALSGIVCASPWVDLTNTASTYVSRAAADRLFSTATANEAAAMYLCDHDRLDPRASPIYADLRGLAPMLVLAGDAEVLLDDARGLAVAAAAQGVDVRLKVFPEMPHVWLLDYPAFPEAARAMDQIAGFIRTAAVR